MPGVSFIFVGKMKEAHFAGAFAEYIKRLGAYTKCSVREIPEQRLPEDPSPGEIAAALAREAREIEKAVPKGYEVCALCVEGEGMTSEALAEYMRKLDSRGSGAAFIVGGSYGLDAELKRRAAKRLSMSRMTFPHHLARVMLAEQVYRAFTINAGKRYHK